MWLVKIAKVSRSGYYKWEATHEKRKTAEEKDQPVKEKIMEIHHQYPFFGYPRMRVALQKAGFIVNHKRIYRLMKPLQIRSVIRKKRRFLVGLLRLFIRIVWKGNSKPKNQIANMLQILLTYQYMVGSTIYLLFKISLTTRSLLGNYPLATT